jgi:Ku protein
MPARPIWRGHLRLALVSCPVALWNPKHERNTIRFNQINPKTGHRIRMKNVDAETDEEVQRRDLVKGYEFSKNRYLLLTDADFDSVKVESSSVMNSRNSSRPAQSIRSSTIPAITSRQTVNPDATCMPCSIKPSRKPGRLLWLVS